MDGGYGIFFEMGGASFKMRGILYPFPATLSDLQMFSLII